MENSIYVYTTEFSLWRIDANISIKNNARLHVFI
jgi:hypothetical protein